MRMILLLVVLAIVALLVVKRLDTGAVPSGAASSDTSVNQPPSVPTRPQDVDKFKKNMDAFMDKAAKKRQKEIDQAAQ